MTPSSNNTKSAQMHGKQSKKRPREVPFRYKYEAAVRSLPNPHSCESQGQNELHQHEYVVVSWGHAAGGRTGIDHEVDRSSGLGHPVYKSRWLGAVKVAAAVHHTLVLDDRGILHAFGESHAQQLGIRRNGTFTKPKQVHPTGLLKNGADFVLAEMTGGTTFSLAREINSVEQLKRTEMLPTALKTLRKLIAADPDNQSLLRARAYIRHELFMANKVAGGAVLTWGTGARGELGHGAEAQVEAPRPIRSLADKQIRSVAAGYEHAIAIGPHGELYTWGRGKHGRLGHGDSSDRSVPTRVLALEKKFMCLAAGGAAHTVVVATGSPQVDDGESGFLDAEVYCFGRGGHGRIGRQDLRHSHVPHLLQLPPSLQAARIRALACGAAHSLLLAVGVVPKSLGRPWGVQTTLYSWGYGSNGQLGNGEISHRHFPAKVKMPTNDVVVEIAAGRSHSLCRTKVGSVFGWGKGWRGQLGLASKRISVVPRPLTLPGICVMISAKYQHSVAICEYGVRSRTSLEQHPPFEELVSRLPRQVPSWSLPNLGCLRKMGEQAVWACRTCGMEPICNACRLLCHKNHHHWRIALTASCAQTHDCKPRGCQCGASQSCRSMSTISDCFSESAQQQFSLEEHAMAIVLQKYARGMVARRMRKQRLAELAEVRRIAVQRFYQQRVLDVVLHKMTRRKQQVFQMVERQRMENEEKLWRLVIYYKRLQLALQALDLTKQVLSVFANACCIWLPTKQPGQASIPTSFLSWFDVRTHQLCQPANDRLPFDQVLALTLDYPIYLSSRARATTDPDIQSLFEHYHTHAHLDRQLLDGEDVSVQPRRRYSVADPNLGYQRMTRFETQMRVGLLKKRRSSLPDLRQMRDRAPAQHFTHRSALENVHSIAQRRELVMLEMLDARYARSLLVLNEKNRRARFRRVLQFSWMNPRLEIQLRERILYPRRRASIAEPERVGIVQEFYQQRRQRFTALRQEGAKQGLRARRRSFDDGERRDVEQGILLDDALTTSSFPDRNAPPTLAELLVMGKKMQQMYTRLTAGQHQAVGRDGPSRSRAASASTDRDSLLTSGRYRAYSTRSTHSGEDSARSSTSDVPATRRASHRTTRLTERTARHTERSARQTGRTWQASGRSDHDSVRDGPAADHHMSTGRSTSRGATSRDMYGSHRTARAGPQQATGRSSGGGGGLDSGHASARSSQGGKETHRSQRSVIANTDLVVIEDRYGREWVEMVDDAGNKYYVDPETNEARWDIALPMEGPYATHRSDLSSR